MEPVTSARKTLVPKSITNRNRKLGAKSLYRLSTWTLPVAGGSCPPKALGTYLIIYLLQIFPRRLAINFFFPNNHLEVAQHNLRGTKPPPAANLPTPGNYS